LDFAQVTNVPAYLKNQAVAGVLAQFNMTPRLDHFVIAGKQ
jgi:hypothetical protein